MMMGDVEKNTSHKRGRRDQKTRIEVSSKLLMTSQNCYFRKSPGLDPLSDAIRQSWRAINSAE